VRGRYCWSDDFLYCAERVYRGATEYVAPRKEFKYLSIHLQLAAAMAVAASGKDIQSLFKE
jgi:hypothetical protein